MIWIDITDVIDFLETAPSVTGIQRTVLDLARVMCAAPYNCRTCAYCEQDATFKAAPLEDLLARVAPSKKARHLETTRYGANRIKARIAKTAVSLVPRTLRKRLGWGSKPAPKRETSSEIKADFRAGDVFVALGAFWHHPNHVDRMGKAVFVHEMKFAIMVHDLIPINHPCWFSPEFTFWWSEKLKNLLRRADSIFVNSRFTATEVREFACRSRIAVGPITTVRLGDPAFTGTAEAASPNGAIGNTSPQYGGTHFILMVGSIDVRKNQKFLLPIWSRLMREIEREVVPNLLLIGKNGTRSHEFFSLLNDSPELSGKVIILDRVRDDELAHYYRKALFTVFPSLAEGWGFPVAESLSFAKVCVASNADSIPEVGGDLICYFGADDHDGAYKLIKNLIVDPAERTELESTIANQYRPTGWAVAAETILATLSRAEAAR